MKFKYPFARSFRITTLSAASILLFANLVTIEYCDSPAYTMLKYVMVAGILMYDFHHIRIHRDDYIIIVAALLMGVGIFYSSYYNHVASFYIRASIYFSILVFSMVLLAIEAGRAGRTRELLLGGKIYLSAVLFCNDLLMVALPNKFYNISGRAIGTTLLGNKFSVAYAHLMLLYILVALERDGKKQKRKALLYSIAAGALCVYVDCSTVLLAVALFVILYYLPAAFRIVLSRPIVYFASYLVCSVILLLFSQILSWTPIQYVIVRILHRDATLTGRMQAYTYIGRLVSSHSMLGYGYGTDIFERTTIWYANAQNALWDFVIRYGFVTLVLMTIYMMTSVYKYQLRHQERGESHGWNTYMMLYVYLFIGIGEIVYNKLFFFYIAMLWAVCVEGELVKAKQG